MKRVKITGFKDELKATHQTDPQPIILEFNNCGLSFPVFGKVDEANDELFIDGDKGPGYWSAYCFQYEEINEQQ